MKKNMKEEEIIIITVIIITLKGMKLMSLIKKKQINMK